MYDEILKKLKRFEQELERLRAFDVGAGGGGGAGDFHDHDHSASGYEGSSFDAANLGSGAATDGQVLTADGAGGSAFEDVPAGGNTVSEGPGIDLVAVADDRQVGLGGDTVLLYDSGGNPVAEYATPQLACAAAGSGDVVVLPAGTFANDLTVPAGVSVIGFSHQSCILTGKITMGAGAFLIHVAVTRTANDANTLYGIVGPASGEAYIHHCRLTCVQSGSGDTAVIAVQDGNLITHDCYLNGTSVGGLGYEVVNEGTGSYTSLHDDFSDVDLSEIGEQTEYHFPADTEGWVANLGGDANASSEWDNSVGHDAVGSLHITRTGGGAETFPTHAWTKAVAGVVGKTGDSLSVWIKHTNPYMSPIFNVRITYADASYDEDTWHPEHQFDWTQRSIAVSAANNGKSISSIRVSETMSGWDYKYGFETWWDDVILTAFSGFEAVGSKFPSGPLGIPAPYSDRAAWDAINFGERHSSDWEDGDSHHPRVSLSDVLEGVLTVNNQELDLKTQAAGTVFAAPSYAEGSPSFRLLTKYDLPLGCVIIEDLGNVIESGEAVGDILQIDDWMEYDCGEEYEVDPATLTKDSSDTTANLFDGNFTNQWLSLSPGPHWVTFAFSHKEFLSKIIVTADAGDWMWADHPEDIYVYGSSTGAFGGEEVEIYHTGALGTGVYTLTFAAPRTGYRYYKITFIRAGANCRVNEVQIFAMESVPVWINTPLVHDATMIDGIPVDLAGITDGQLLVYDEGAGEIVPSSSSGYDANAFHDNEDSEFWALIEASPSYGDLFVFEDASASYAKKKVSYENLGIGGGGGGGHEIQDDSVAMTQRAALNFIGFTVEDDAGNDATKVTLPGVSEGVGDVLLDVVVGAGGVASFDKSDIAAGYDLIKIWIMGRTEEAADNSQINLYFNNDSTTSNYRKVRHYAGAAHATAEADDLGIGFISGNNALANAVGLLEIEIFDYDNTAFHKTAIGRSSHRRSATVSYLDEHGLHWENTAAITRITLNVYGGSDFAENTHCMIVGYKNRSIVSGETEGARVYNNADISVANNAVTALTFNSERYDTDTIHDTSTNSDRLTCKTAGKYLITGHVSFAANATGSRQVLIRHGASTYIAVETRDPATEATFQTRITISTIYDLAVGDYVCLDVFQNITGGGALNVLYEANFSPEFMMQRIGDISESTPVDGWVAIPGTFTYASATTINVASGAASRYAIGDRIRFQNNDSGTYLYAYIVGIADTLLTVKGDAVPNATLTDAYYSHEISPVGFPQWFAWTPTLTGGNADLSGYTLARFSLNGRTCTIVFTADNKSMSGSAGASIITLPIAAAQSYAFPFFYRLYYSGQGAPIYEACLNEITAGSANLQLYKTSDGTTFAASETGIYIRLNGSYEI